MNDVSNQSESGAGEDAVRHLPELVRLNYFYGQMLGHQDLLAEQSYLRNKLKLINRCLHGYGVVCGLEVRPEPTPKICESTDEKRRRELTEQIAVIEAEMESLKSKKDAGEDVEKEIIEYKASLEACRRKMEQLPASNVPPPAKRIRVSGGLALDCQGNELLVRRPILVDDIEASLPAREARKLCPGKTTTLYVSLCYVECPALPSRPIALDTCAMTSACQHARVREDACIRISTEKPKSDRRCEFCCEPCEDPCVLLAVIYFDPAKPIEAAHFDNGVRRRFGLYEPTVITGIGFKHGATYSSEKANDLLGTHDKKKGIEVCFSRPIRVETITPGVFDLLRIHRGRGMAGQITQIEGEYVDLPKSGFVSSVIYRDDTGEELYPGDRLLFIIRAGFILDSCCRPVDGENVGGRIPQIGKPWHREHEAKGSCARPPGRFGPWTSGDGVPGGEFQAWFYIEQKERRK
ncbi:MAG: hypothetical protein U1E38_06160 [Rhodospirillales bacterium]